MDPEKNTILGYLGGSNLITTGSHLPSSGKPDNQSMTKIQLDAAGLECGGKRAKKSWWPPEAENGSSLAPERKQEFLPYHDREVNSANSLKEQEVTLPPTPPPPLSFQKGT